MSSVYLAQDRTAGDAEVAVKILNTSHTDEIKQEMIRRVTFLRSKTFEAFT